MKPTYSDIVTRIEEDPTWFDENGAPRYGKFTPDQMSNIYADEVVLLEIACQSCRKRFLVEMNFSRSHAMMQVARQAIDAKLDANDLFDKIKSFSDEVKSWSEQLKLVESKEHLYVPLHYGDPPNHGCTGDTMNCYDLKIVEFWVRDFESESTWLRRGDLEVALEDIE